MAKVLPQSNSPIFSKYLYPTSRSSNLEVNEHASGALIHNSRGTPYLLVVECSGKGIHEATEKALHFAGSCLTIGVVAVFVDAQLFHAYRRRFATEGWDEIPDIEYHMGSRRTHLNLPLSTFPLSRELEGLFFEIHSSMRDIDGLHPDEALEELCKLIYTRTYEEEQSSSRAPFPLKSENFGSTEEYAASIRAFYREAADYDLRVFRLKIPQYERSRGVFNRPIRLSSAALAKCYRMLEDFNLSESQTDVKGRAFQRVLSKATRSGMGQYFTPTPICELMASIVEPRVSELILDPFCGSGHFLSECLKLVQENGSNSSKAFHEFAFGKLHGIEKSDRMVRVAMTDMRLNGDGHSNIRCTDALLDFANYPDISPDSFDVVITNPPFGSILSAEAIATLGHFDLVRGKRNSPLEVLGLERSIQFLRPGGRIAILLPDNIFSADSMSFVREWVLKKVVPRVIVSLPVETFSPFGANVKTGILFARKLMVGENGSKNSPVSMIQITNVGYDASGREISGADLGAAIMTAKTFLAKEGW